MSYYDVPKCDEAMFSAPNFEKWLNAELANRVQANQRQYQAAVKEWQEIIVKVRNLFGEKSAPYKYMKRQGIASPPDLQRRAKKIWRQYADWQRREAAREYRQDYKQRSHAADLNLQQLGYIPGEDYSPTRAISTVRRMIYEDELRAQENQP